MEFLEPIQAAESYEAAVKGNPTDIQLIKKLGTSLVLMHDYDKASRHYESAIKLLGDDDLRFEFLELLIKVDFLNNIFYRTKHRIQYKTIIHLVLFLFSL